MNQKQIEEMHDEYINIPQGKHDKQGFAAAIISEHEKEMEEFAEWCSFHDCVYSEKKDTWYYRSETMQEEELNFKELIQLFRNNK